MIKKDSLHCYLMVLGFVLSVVVVLYGTPFQDIEPNSASASERKETMNVVHASTTPGEAKPPVVPVTSTGLQTATFALG